MALARLQWPLRRDGTSRGWRWTLAQGEVETPPDGASLGGKAAARARTSRAPSAAQAEYEGFIHEHERAILNYLWRVTGDEQSAYDLAQEVFVRAWQRFERVRAYENPRAWLFRVATNLALTAIARRRIPSASTEPPGWDPAASDPAGRVVERDLVRSTLQRLAPQRRAALTLREVYGLSCAEVARALGISEPAARMALSRAREQFRALYLQEEGASHGE